MAGALVASQFLEAQNWALGSAMAMVLIFSILICLTLGALTPSPVAPGVGGPAA